MRGVIGAGEALVVMPPVCTETPPSIANAFSDGSVSNPSQSDFRLGGTGVWHPRRNQRDIPLSAFELSTATIRFTNDGGELPHVYNGHDVDSYRTEVLRIIASMGRHGGLYLL